jgi:hypothetical protein
LFWTRHNKLTLTLKSVNMRSMWICDVKVIELLHPRLNRRDSWTVCIKSCLNINHYLKTSIRSVIQCFWQYCNNAHWISKSKQSIFYTQCCLIVWFFWQGMICLLNFVSQWLVTFDVQDFMIKRHFSSNKLNTRLFFFISNLTLDDIVWSLDGS